MKIPVGDREVLTKRSPKCCLAPPSERSLQGQFFVDLDRLSLPSPGQSNQFHQILVNFGKFRRLQSILVKLSQI